MDRYGNIKEIRIKKWFLIQKGIYAGSNNDIKCGKHNEYSWFKVNKETDKAYHLNMMQGSIWEGGWLPKGCVLESRDV